MHCHINYKPEAKVPHADTNPYPDEGTALALNTKPTTKHKNEIRTKRI